jgi:AAA ATPase domain
MNADRSRANPRPVLSPPLGPAWSPIFVDREGECRRLREAVLKGGSLSIVGPAGIGKSALVARVIPDLPAEVASRCLYLAGAKDLQDLLRQLIRALNEAGDPHLRRLLRAEGVSALAFGGWLKSLSSSRLRGTLYRSIEQGNYRVFLDHLPRLTPAVARVIKELFWMRRTPVYLLPRAGDHPALTQFAHFFYWGDRDRLLLGPLPLPAAQELLESCIEGFGLARLDLTDFRGEILELSKQIPGAMVKMCALAADPRYQYGSRVKTKSVYIDYLMTGHALRQVGHPPSASPRSNTVRSSRAG